MTLEALRRQLVAHGYTLAIEDKSRIDATEVYAVYRGTQRMARFGSLAGVAQWLAR